MVRNYTNEDTLTTLASGISAAATTITLSQHGSRYPSENFTVTISDQDATPNQEVVLISSRSGNTLTVATNGRGWDGTTATAFDAGDAIECTVVAADMDRLWRSTTSPSINDYSSTATDYTAGGSDGTLYTLHDKTFTDAPAGLYLVMAHYNPDTAADGTVTLVASSGGGTAVSFTDDFGSHGGVEDDYIWKNGVYTHTGGDLYVRLAHEGEGTNTVNYGRTTDVRWSRGFTVVGPLGSQPPAGFSGARVKITSDELNLTDGAYYKIPWDATDFDTDNYWSSGSSTRLTVPVDGYYHISGHVGFFNIGSATNLEINALVNNSSGYGLARSDNTGLNNNEVLPFTHTIWLDADDYVEIRALIDDTTSTSDLRAVYTRANITRLYSAGAVKLDDLTDVDTTTTAPSTGDLLRWDGANWVPYQNNLISDYAGGTYDDEFDDDTVAAAWTKVDYSGNEATWTEGYGALVVEGRSDTAGYFHAILKSGGTIATGTIIETHMRAMAFHSQYPAAGLLFTDGTTENSGNQSLLAIHFGTAHGVQATDRDNFRTRASFTDGPTVRGYGFPAAGLYMRWKYTSANTYDGYVSLDGNIWEQVITSFSSSFTPTHFGLWIESWATSLSYYPQAQFDYFRVT